MNYYDILEVAHTASPEVIQNAYKTLAKKYHPDVFQGDKSFAEDQMKRINEAYEVLSDPQKRMEYDRRIKDAPNSNSDNEETAKNNSSNVADTKEPEQPKVKQKRKKPFWALSWIFICFLMFLSIMFEWKWMFWIGLVLGCGRFIVNKKEPSYKTHGLVRIISIGAVGFMIFSCYVIHYDDTPVAQTSESSTSVSQHEDSDVKNNNFDSLGITKAPDITDLTDTTDSSRNLLGTFTQVGLYDHEAYTHLNSEYIPTIYIYDDNTFEFHCNFYEGMKVYEGSWLVSEDSASAEYHFMVENEPSLPNLDFYINHNKSRCDADFLTDYSLDAPFGMTSVEDVLFHPDIAGSESQNNTSESSEIPITIQTVPADNLSSDSQSSEELTICDIALADFDDISDYAEEYDIKLYHTRKIRNIIQDASKLWKKISEDNTTYVCREKKLFTDEYWTKTLYSYNAEAYYIGKLKDNKPSGVGILVENENVIYIGEFIDGRYDGIGVLMSYATNHIDYCGEFKNGMYHGEGQSITYIIDDSGAKLNGIMAGDYKESCLDGKYKVYYDGCLYLDAELDAFGTGYVEMYFPKSDQLEYKGQMKKQQYHGRGTLYDKNGDVIYSGNWKNGDCD